MYQPRSDSRTSRMWRNHVRWSLWETAILWFFVITWLAIVKIVCVSTRNHATWKARNKCYMHHYHMCRLITWTDRLINIKIRINIRIVNRIVNSWSWTDYVRLQRIYGIEIIISSSHAFIMLLNCCYIVALHCPELFHCSIIVSNGFIFMMRLNSWHIHKCIKIIIFKLHLIFFNFPDNNINTIIIIMFF